ncbi:10329_t:CDS:2, partial [Diversispora eburnea]
MPKPLTKRRARVRDTSTFETLRRLRQTGGSRLQEYEIKQDEDIYEEVNEETYQNFLNEEIKKNNFIEDDDGTGQQYINDDLGKEYSSDSESGSDYDETLQEDGQSCQIRSDQKINAFFQRALLKPKTVKTTAEETEFMSCLLQDLDNDVGDSELDLFQIPNDNNNNNNNNREKNRISKKNNDNNNNYNSTQSINNTDNNNFEYMDFQGWDDDMSDLEFSNVVTTINGNDAKRNHEIDKGNKDINQDTIRMYWIDAYEKQGIVYLFGKTFDKIANSYVSCCVTVQNIQRNLFFLSRKFELDVKFDDAFKEVIKIREKYKIKRFEVKNTSRKYAFGLPDVPVQSDYLKVVYSFD